MKKLISVLSLLILTALLTSCGFYFNKIETSELSEDIDKAALEEKSMAIADDLIFGNCEYTYDLFDEDIQKDTSIKALKFVTGFFDGIGEFEEYSDISYMSKKVNTDKYILVEINCVFEEDYRLLWLTYEEDLDLYNLEIKDVEIK